MTKLYGIINKNVDEIQNEISRIIYESDGFNMLYVSIGGKLNEYAVQFRENPKKKYATNSRQQMYPRFLRNRHQKNKILIIAVDNFRDRFVFENNKKIIEDILDDNVTFVMINYLFNTTTLGIFMQFITKVAKNNEIERSRFMICNFVKHLNEPNIRELRDEEMIPETIHRILSLPENSEYSDGFYEWFGYRFYLYNFIYRYKPYAKRLILDIELFMENQQNDNNMKSISVLQNMALVQFLDNVFDITMYIDDESNDTNFGISLKTYLYDKKQIIMPLPDLLERTDNYSDQSIQF